MANEDKGPWWVVGIQIHAAMDRDRGRVEAFLAEHTRQATDVCLEFLRTIPADVEVDLAPLVEHLGEQILTHTRFLFGQADLSATQAERLMAASRQGYDRFAGAFRAEVLEGRGRPGDRLLPGIEAALAAGGRCDASRSPAGAPIG